MAIEKKLEKVIQRGPKCSEPLKDQQSKMYLLLNCYLIIGIMDEREHMRSSSLSPRTQQDQLYLSHDSGVLTPGFGPLRITDFHLI